MHRVDAWIARAQSTKKSGSNSSEKRVECKKLDLAITTRGYTTAFTCSEVPRLATADIAFNHTTSRLLAA